MFDIQYLMINESVCSRGVVKQNKLYLSSMTDTTGLPQRNMFYKTVVCCVLVQDVGWV